jgi:hypothetical protein
MTIRLYPEMDSRMGEFASFGMAAGRTTEVRLRVSNGVDDGGCLVNY